MTLGGDDQQPTPAEVLASIRRTIRTNLLDDPQSPGSAPPHASAAEADGDDFELPAMFRRDREDLPSTSLVDRLGAALRPPPIPSAPDVLSSLKPIFPPAELAVIPPLFEPRTAASRETVGSDDGHSAPLPREMPSCRDRLVVRMAAARVGPAVGVPPREPRVVPKATMGSFNYLIGAGSVIGERHAADSDAETRTLPPALSRTPDTLETDAAAQLRPMLKQWLDENLNRVFTEALISTLQRDRDT